MIILKIKMQQLRQSLSRFSAYAFKLIISIKWSWEWRLQQQAFQTCNNVYQNLHLYNQEIMESIYKIIDLSVFHMPYFMLVHLYLNYKESCRMLYSYQWYKYRSTATNVILCTKLRGNVVLRSYLYPKKRLKIYKTTTLLQSLIEKEQDVIIHLSGQSLERI